MNWTRRYLSDESFTRLKHKRPLSRRKASDTRCAQMSGGRSRSWSARVGRFYRLLDMGGVSGNHYFFGPYLSPFYSPEIFGASPHSWFGPKLSWWPGWLLFSPALLILSGRRVARGRRADDTAVALNALSSRASQTARDLTVTRRSHNGPATTFDSAIFVDRESASWVTLSATAGSLAICAARDDT
jgi:hypothetical protein